MDYPKDRLEVLYIDGGSTDDSVSTVRARGVRVLMAGGAGSAADCRNVGWRAATHDVIHFVDGDVFISPGYLRAAVRQLDVDGVACVFGMLTERNATTNWVSRVLETDWRAKLPGDADSPGAGGTFLRRALADVGGYRAGALVAEETDLGQRLRAFGYRILLLDTAMGTHDYGVKGVGGLLARAFRLGGRFGILFLLPGEKEDVLHRPMRKLLLQAGGLLALGALLASHRQWLWLCLFLPVICVALIPYVLIRHWQQVVARGLGWPALTYYYLGYASKPVLLSGALWRMSVARLERKGN
jgi:GT2 family glycosyltransferase